jgi:hypothetical protein
MGRKKRRKKRIPDPDWPASLATAKAMVDKIDRVSNTSTHRSEEQVPAVWGKL